MLVAYIGQSHYRCRNRDNVPDNFYETKMRVNYYAITCRRISIIDEMAHEKISVEEIGLSTLINLYASAC